MLVCVCVFDFGLCGCDPNTCFVLGKKKSCEQTMRVSTVADLRSLKGTVTCETPNNAINKFTGGLSLNCTHVERRGGEMNSSILYIVVQLSAGTLELNSGSVPIPPTSLLLRGCTLRNTEWIYGLVINTGPDTKIMQAATATPSKWSRSSFYANCFSSMPSNRLIFSLILFFSYASSPT